MATQKSDIIKTDGEIKKAIGQKIQLLRKSKNLSAETLSNNIGISRVSLTQIETGKTHVNAVVLWKLACRLECSVNEFFPIIPQGYGLSKMDLSHIGQADEDAVKW